MLALRHILRCLPLLILLFVFANRTGATQSPAAMSQEQQELSAEQIMKLLPSQPLPVLATPAPKAPRLLLQSYVVAYRSPGHVRFSDPDAFHNAARSIRDWLGVHHVAIAEDPMRGMIETSELFSIDSLLNLAREARASYLLYITIDRPVTKWLKIKIQCYDLTGRLLWEEEASHGGGLSSRNSLERVTRELELKLTPKLGSPGLATTAVEAPEARGGSAL